MKPSVERVNVLGCMVSAINLDLAWEKVREAISRKEKGYVCVTGVHGVIEAQSDAGFKDILNRAFLVTPDGMPMSWMGWLQGADQMDRVYGPDLMLMVCDRGRHEGVRHFLYGGNDGVAPKLAASLRKRFPGLEIAGTYSPPFRPLNEEENEDLRVMVADVKPDVFWVGLSTPKQERFMAENLERLDATLMFGVGAAFDFHAGLVPQAPRWIQRAGLEWFYRVVKEPKRLWKRYLTIVPAFLFRAFAQTVGLKRYPAPAE